VSVCCQLTDECLLDVVKLHVCFYNAVLAMFLLLKMKLCLRRKRKAQEEEEEEQKKKLQKEWDKNYEVCYETYGVILLPFSYFFTVIIFHI